jgi:predicted methyltransferase MtxX (methanogen marker protein 4)
MTLIYSANSSGCTGKCDANCYNATTPHCDCICGGRNHGVGERQARDNTAKYAEEMIKEHAKNTGTEVKDYTVNEALKQLSIF